MLGAREPSRNQNGGRAEVSRTEADRDFFIGLARALGGAIIFALPMMMTMEMWHLGFYLDRLRVALLLVVMFPLLVGVSHFSGYRPTFNFAEDAEDALVAYAVGFAASAVMLLLFNVLPLTGAFDHMLGAVALQAVPGSLGALLARSQFGGQSREGEEKPSSYGGELFVMVVGALFLALNVAPTEEMILIAFKMSPWHSLALLLVSLATMHAFVYAMAFHGQEPSMEMPQWLLFLRFTCVGYALVLLVSLYVLWTFDRTSGVSPMEVLGMAIVLGFPGAIGAAASRLIL